MMSAFRRRKVQVAAAVVLVPVVIVVGFAMYLASVAGDLPWQTDPTRISEGFVPFAGIQTPTRIPTRAATPRAATPGISTPRAGTPTAVPST
ncbi:MAG TPA: hypothetical protein VH482_03205 [Thermomicrobiales bacterium]|jgi:hypothetical protein